VDNIKMIIKKSLQVEKLYRMPYLHRSHYHNIYATR